MLSTARMRGAARGARRVAVVAGAGTAALVVMAGAAFAHITVTPPTAAQGSSAELTFKVPNEEASADTVEVRVKIPTDHPVAQLLARPVPGWAVRVQTVKLAEPIVTDDGQVSTAVSEVTWTGGKIPPGQYQDFSVSADPLPTGTAQLVFKALQTYSNGDIVRWIDVQQPGQPEPDHPAPVLTLTRAAADSAAPAAAAGSGSGAATAAAGGDDGTARALGIAGLAAGGLGLVFGLAGLLRSRQARSP
jgi:uncharacterized protein YcnI